MNSRVSIVSIVLTIMMILIASKCYAHFTIMIPDKFMYDRGDTVNVYVAFGHPFEHIIMPSEEVSIINAKAYSPEGKVVSVDVLRYNETHYKVSFSCVEEGDYVVAVTVKAIHGEEVTVDYAKTVIHCGTEEKGWDRVIGSDAEIVVLTRPYGLEVPAIITGIIYSKGEPVKNIRVEIEKYHAKEPTQLLEELEEKYTYPDAYITKATLTDSNGLFYAVLNEPGIWLLGVELGEVEGGGVVRASYTIYVSKQVTTWPPKPSIEDISNKVDSVESRVSNLESRVENVETRIEELSKAPTAPPELGTLSGLAYAAIALAIIAIIIAGVALARSKR